MTRLQRRPDGYGSVGLALSLLLLLAVAPTWLSPPGAAAAEHDATPPGIDAVLDDFHAAAAAGDASRYLAHFAPDAVFLGTDDWERWPLDTFRDYVRTRFADAGWTYLPRQRHVAVVDDTAWFDEIVESPRWGRFRGTGVLRRIDGHWRIAHYALSFLVPNERWEAVAETASAGFAERRGNGEAP